MSDVQYYWTRQSQEQEQIALREYAAGDFVEFDDVEDALAWLRANTRRPA